MQRYEKYKDSGVEWIGEIPEGWEVKKLKYGVTVNPSKDGIDKISSDLVVFLPMEKVTEDGVIDCSIKKPISDLYNGFTCFSKNDVIVAKITPCFENGKGAFLNKLTTEIGFGSTEFHVLRVQKDVCDLFLYYVTKSEIFMKIGEAFMSGAAGQKRVPTDFIADFPLVSPSKQEQTTIANYLNRKTAEIDQLIAQKERLVALYEEEKTALINQAVTQGINPKATLKESGIDWLGEIPEHWEVKSLKVITKIIRGKFGHRPRNDPAFYGGKYPFIQTGDVASAEKHVKRFNQTLNEKGFAVSQEFPLGTLVMTIAANIGDLAILSFKACFPDSIIGFYPRHKNSSEFLYYLFTSMKLEFLRVSTSNTQLNINIDRISPLKVPVPPVKEQTAIVQHIETETTRINTKITQTKKIIALQKEYRTALISEVVTGKVKVT